VLLWRGLKFRLGNQFQGVFLFYLKDYKSKTAASQAAIPPLIEIRGFLAEIL
jgi:hypothetical protein